MVNLRRKTENYGFTTIYIPGSDNDGPDAWSRRVPTKEIIKNLSQATLESEDSIVPDETIDKAQIGQVQVKISDHEWMTLDKSYQVQVLCSYLSSPCNDDFFNDLADDENDLIAYMRTTSVNSITASFKSLSELHATRK